MTDETKKTESKFSEIVKGILKPGPKPDSVVKPQEEVPQFRWFTLVTIPSTKDKTIDTFNDQVAQWTQDILQTQDSLQNAEELSFLELYLTRTAMNRLINDVKINKNYTDLVKTIDRRIFNTDYDQPQASSKVGFNRKALLITPALQRLFNNAFIARVIEPPQVYVPTDESKIPANVDQYLIGALRIENAKGEKLHETPIRALSNSVVEQEDILRLYAHTDFDILLKAFPDDPVCSYPLGINIICTLDIDGTRRAVSQVDLDIHDAQLFAKSSQKDENTGLSYSILEGGLRERDVLKYPDDSYPVDLKSEKEVAQEYYDIAPGVPVSVNGKVGLQVSLRYRNDKGRIATDSYKFLFRFFRYALRFNTGQNRIEAKGQFVRGSSDTVVMLPPLSKDGRTESQMPAFIISPVQGQESVFRIRKHLDSTLKLFLNGNPISSDPVQVELTGRIEIQGEKGTEGDSQVRKI